MNLKAILVLLLATSASISAEGGKKGNHHTWINNHSAPVTIKAAYVQKHATGGKTIVKESYHLRPGESKKPMHRDHDEHSDTTILFHHPKHNHVEHIRHFHKADHDRLGAGTVINLAAHAPKKNQNKKPAPAANAPKKNDHHTWMNNHKGPVTIHASYAQRHADGETTLVKESHHLRPGEAKKTAHRDHDEHVHTTLFFHHPKHGHLQKIRHFHKADHKKIGAGAVINLADHAPKKGKGKGKQPAAPAKTPAAPAKATAAPTAKK